MKNYVCRVEIEATVLVEVAADSAEEAAGRAALEVGQADFNDLDFEPESLRVGCLARYPEEQL